MPIHRMKQWRDEWGTRNTAVFRDILTGEYICRIQII
jgi:hypothetical protein